VQRYLKRLSETVQPTKDEGSIPTTVQETDTKACRQTEDTQGPGKLSRTWIGIAAVLIFSVVAYLIYSLHDAQPPPSTYSLTSQASPTATSLPTGIKIRPDFDSR
jgi:hypothetical protein